MTPEQETESKRRFFASVDNALEKHSVKDVFDVLQAVFDAKQEEFARRPRVDEGRALREAAEGDLVVVNRIETACCRAIVIADDVPGWPQFVCLVCPECGRQKLAEGMP